MKLTPEDVKRIALLARLKLSDDEIPLYQQQLGEVLGYVKQLEEADVTDIPITSQVSGLTTVLADDEVEPGLASEAALGNAPAREGSSLKVKAVFRSNDA